MSPDLYDPSCDRGGNATPVLQVGVLGTEPHPHPDSKLVLRSTWACTRPLRPSPRSESIYKWIVASERRQKLEIVDAALPWRDSNIACVHEPSPSQREPALLGGSRTAEKQRTQKM
ncbi:hypothetical protein B0H14DRAFT_3493718 [Mycena olivaceomarginata]|nr:hypothetical protein B0H14DRAFT_3493718 [Mycena olivaceomarginata]